MAQPTNSECPNGKTYGITHSKRHCFTQVGRERLPHPDPRGDYFVVEKCKFCGEVRESFIAEQ